jgi:hypothetical protein
VRRPALALAALLTAVLPASAEVPDRTEQVVYVIVAFSGKEYTPTFAPESSGTIYLTAGKDNFLSIRKTLVYWWPLTAEWKTDQEALNEHLGGTLVLTPRGRGEARRLDLQTYTYFNVRGEYELDWQVAVGEAAARELEHSRALSAAWYDASLAYQDASAVYQDRMGDFLARINRARELGQDTAALQAEAAALAAPVAPQAPSEYAVPPVELQQAFVVNLPVGEYDVRLVASDGTIIEGSEKRLVVWSRRRGDRVGYEVIPADKWTRAEESTTPASVIYIDGTTDLYLRPFYEDEVQDLSYQKTSNNAAAGNPNVYTWVRVQQVPKARIAYEARGRPASLLVEQPYRVEQSEGSALGYTIVPVGPAPGSAEVQPDLIAFHVPVSRGGAVMRVRTVGADGEPIAGSERQIRVVARPAWQHALLALALLPVLAMVVVLVARARRYSS